MKELALVKTIIIQGIFKSVVFSLDRPKTSVHPNYTRDCGRFQFDSRISVKLWQRCYQS